AATAGVYQLTVTGIGPTSRSGSYRLETIVRAAATRADRQRMKAEALMNEANELVKEGVKTAPQRIEKLVAALPLWQELGEPYWSAATLYRVGETQTDLNEYKQAIEYYEQALVKYREAKHRIGEAETLYSIGVAYGRLGQYEKTIEFHEQALAINREIK